MRRSVLRLLLLAAIAIAPNACRFGYGPIGENLGGDTSAGSDDNPDDAGSGSPAGGGLPAGTAGTGGVAGLDDGTSGGGATAGSEASGGDGAAGDGVAGRGGAPAGGAAGRGGSAGRAGAGAAGRGGTAGASSAGRGGSAGAAGLGGSAGSSGASGSAGSAGAGGIGGADALVVTTEADEANSGATPSSPGQTGFSLREAIAFANGKSGHQAITFDSSVKTIKLSSPLPTVQDSLDISGSIAVDATQSSTSGACLTVSASNVLIDSLEIHHCKGEPVLFSSSSSSGNELSHCYLHDNVKAAVVYGDGAVVFFNYVLSSGGPGIEIYSTNAQVLANEVVASTGSNIVVHNGANAVTLLANLSVGGDAGIDLGAVVGATVWHNTIAASVSAALRLGTATQVDARNNIFSGAGSYGISGSSSQFSKLDYDLFYGNASGNCSACTPGSASVFANPQFTDPSTFDYSLKTGSPAINAGFDLGVDRNLDSPGLYNGSGPDLGFVEAP